MNKFMTAVLRPQTMIVSHPESPGMNIVVTRTWLGRFFKHPHFATLSETIKYYESIR